MRHLGKLGADAKKEKANHMNPNHLFVTDKIQPNKQHILQDLDHGANQYRIMKLRKVDIKPSEYSSEKKWSHHNCSQRFQRST